MSATTIALILVATYLIGTLPTAWLVVRQKGQDIREEGSGNVGAMNTLGVTGSKRRFILVFIVDTLKGVVAVLAARYLAGEASIIGDSLAILGVVLGHNINVWLSIPRGRIEGGKGLASGIGGLAASVMPLIIPVWIGAFIVGFFLYKSIWGIGKIAPGTTLATLTVPIAAYIFYGSTVYGTTAVLIMCIVTFAIVIKHVPEMKELLASRPAQGES